MEQTFRQVTDGLWVADRSLRVTGGLSLPIRMTVLELTPARLLIYSPVAPDTDLLEAISGIGDVAWIVAPNRFHTRWFRAWVDRFPAACAVDTDNPLPTLPRGTVLESFALNDKLNELVIYHDQSRSLVLCDLMFNLSAQQKAQLPWLVRQLLRANGLHEGPCHTRAQRWFVIRRHDEMARFYDWAMTQPFTRLSMAHGGLLSDTGRYRAREAVYSVFKRYRR